MILFKSRFITLNKISIDNINTKIYLYLIFLIVIVIDNKI